MLFRCDVLAVFGKIKVDRRFTGLCIHIRHFTPKMQGIKSFAVPFANLGCYCLLPTVSSPEFQSCYFAGAPHPSIPHLRCSDCAVRFHLYRMR